MTAFTGTAQALTSTVSPTSVSSDYAESLTLTLAGVSSGQSYVVSKFLDANGSGALDANDLLVQSFTVADGQVFAIDGVRNSNMPGDADGAVNGQIQVELKFKAQSEANFCAGKYIYTAASTAGGPSATASLVVTQPVYPQGVKGRITGGGQPVPFTPVFLMDNSGNMKAMTLADANGNFTLNSPSGGYGLGCLARGYLFNFSSPPVVIINSGAWTTQNLTVTPANCNISGQLTDRDTGAGIPGIQMFVQGNNGMATLAFSDAAGHFSVPVSTTSAGWELDCSGPDAAMHGYLRPENNPVIDVGGGDVTGINLQFAKANALVYGFLQGDPNHALAGLQVEATDPQSQWHAYGRINSSGKYVVGVVAGEWNIEPDNDQLSPLGYLGLQANATISADSAVQVDLVVRTFTANLRGRIVDYTGQPIGGVYMAAYLYGGPGWHSVLTDDNGQFSLPVFGGDWSIELDSKDAAQRGLVRPSLSFTVQDGTDINNILYTVHQATAQITGSVKNQANQPIANIGVYSYINQNGLDYNEWTETDASGNYRLNVFDGEWTVAVEDLTGRGYENLAPRQAIVSGANVAVDFTAQAQSGSQADVTFFGLLKQQSDFVQNDASSPPALASGNSYHFNSWINLSAPGAVLSATLRLPDGTTYSMSPDGGDAFRFSTNFASLDALDGAFPTGNYTMTMNTLHDGIRTATLAMTNAVYPNTPVVSNYDSAQAVNPDDDLPLDWQPFAGGTSMDFIQFRVRSSQGSTVFSTGQPGEPGALNGAQTGATIPAFYLPSNQALQGQLMFARIAGMDTQSYPGAFGVVGFTKQTVFSLVTLPSSQINTNPPPGAHYASVPSGASFDFATGSVDLSGNTGDFQYLQSDLVGKVAPSGVSWWTGNGLDSFVSWIAQPSYLPPAEAWTPSSNTAGSANLYTRWLKAVGGRYAMIYSLNADSSRFDFFYVYPYGSYTWSIHGTPQPPTLLSVSDAGTGGALVIEWQPSPSPTVAGYKVWSGPDLTLSDIDNLGNVTNYTLRGLQNGQSYSIRVAAYDIEGNESGLSSAMSATPSIGGASSLRITSTVLPEAAAGLVYHAILEATGGQPPYQWSTAPGSLPLPYNLGLAPDGTIGGTPTADGTYFFSVRVTDSAQHVADQSMSLVVNPGGELPAVMSQPFRLATGEFQCVINGASGQSYVVEASSDLKTWTEIQTVAATNGVIFLKDSYAPAYSHRFYRARSH
ncbi:MAG: fibronectin type III domain-containing protein [Candidatus Omnitrophica bacterium]|nr:fibronectin type III domain-containing protein [Candidatus Omnitrophota bacterium]